MYVSKAKLLASTPVLDTSQFASGDQVGVLTKLTDLFDDEGGTAKLISLAVLDKAGQKAAFDILFFNAAVAVASTENAALNITDALMAASFVGKVSVATADYIDLSASSVATYNNLNLLLQAAAKYKDLWYIIRSAGTPTYAADSLTLKFGVIQD